MKKTKSSKKIVLKITMSMTICFTFKILCRFHFKLFTIGKVAVEYNNFRWWRLIWRRMR